MTYVNPHMREALGGHKLRCICNTDLVKVYLMHREGTGTMRVQLAFTPEGIHLTGDICLGRDNSGISTAHYKPLGWFANPELSESYLCGKFLTKQLQQEVMVADARRNAEEYAREAADTQWNQERNVELAGKWLALAVALERCNDEHEAVQCMYEHYSEVDDPDSFENFGMDYPLTDAGWLCAIQERFARLYTELSDDRHLLDMTVRGLGHQG